MDTEKMQEHIDRTFHNHGDILIKVFSILVALLLLGLWFLATSQSAFQIPSSDIQQNIQ